MKGPAFTPVEIQRARSNLYEIAVDLLPAGTRWRDEANHEKRAEHSGGLSINLKKGAWWLWAEEVGNYSPLSMVAALRPGYSAAERISWLQAWLLTHPGTGSCTLDGVDEDEDEDADEGAAAARASAEQGADFIARRQPIAGTADGEAYLRSRGVDPPYPVNLGYVADARNGEGAIVALLEARERPVAVLATYIIPDGAKSLVHPVRERFNLEQGQKGAVFRLPASEAALAGPRDPVADYLIVEGVEDALTLHQLGRPCTILGLPGIGTLAALELPKKSRVVIFEDGDEKDSPAGRGCIRGIDHLINAGMVVRTVPTPLGLDANAILNEPNLGIEHLHWMLRRENLFTPSLSFEARVAKLAKLTGLPFAQERAAIQKIFKRDGITAKQIDEALKPHRPRPGKPAGADGTSPGEPPAPPPDPIWEKPLPPLGIMLDTAAKTLPRFLAAKPYVHDVITLWSFVTHLVQNEEVALPIMPQLSFQSSGPDSGKSAALETTATLSFRGQARSSYTAATLFRRIAELGMTFCLSELHNILTDKNSEMRAIVDACHRRAEAFVDRTETDAKTGKRYVVTYPCWAPLAWASIGSLAREIQSRAIVLLMQPALPEEYRQLDHSSPSKYPALIDARRQFAAYAATINQPLDHVLPEGVFNRLADNWRPLFAIAAMAGGDWPARVQTAMEEVGKVEKTVPREVRLLASMREALEAAKDHRLGTADLIDKLCEDEEAGWTEANHGKRITAYWLRDNLCGLLDPPGSQEWQEGEEPNRTHQFLGGLGRVILPVPVGAGPARDQPSPFQRLEALG